MTTFTIELILIILLVHWLADFVIQTDYQATNKYKSVEQLTYHVLSYTGVWIIPSIIMLNSALDIIFFLCITFVTHFLVDYVSSKLSHKYFNTTNYHNAFVVIGFDQLLHYAQIILTILLLKAS